MNKPHRYTRPLALAAGALLFPLVAAVPSHASTTDSGCTVTPERPAYSGKNTAGNIPLVDYKVTAHCDAGLTLHLTRVIWEQDLKSREGDPKDDKIDTVGKDFSFPKGGTKHLTLREPLPNTGPASEGPIEEMYLATSFTVSNGPVTSAPTPFELTDIRSIHH
jgi:hypothetical protein